MAGQKITIQEVTTKKELKTFLRFPWKIYRGDPHWVPPLLKEYAFHFSPKNPFLHHAEIVPKDLIPLSGDLSAGICPRGSVGGDVVDPGRQSPHAKGARGHGGEEI